MGMAADPIFDLGMLKDELFQVGNEAAIELVSGKKHVEHLPGRTMMGHNDGRLTRMSGQGLLDESPGPLKLGDGIVRRKIAQSRIARLICALFADQLEVVETPTDRLDAARVLSVKIAPERCEYEQNIANHGGTCFEVGRAIMPNISHMSAQQGMGLVEFAAIGFVIAADQEGLLEFFTDLLKELLEAFPAFEIGCLLPFRIKALSHNDVTGKQQDITFWDGHIKCTHFQMQIGSKMELQRTDPFRIEFCLLFIEPVGDFGLTISGFTCCYR